MSDYRYLTLPDDKELKRHPGDEPKLTSFARLVCDVVLQDVRFGKGKGIRIGLHLEEAFDYGEAPAGKVLKLRGDDWRMLKDTIADLQLPSGVGYFAEVARGIVRGVDWIDLVADAPSSPPENY